MAKISTFELVLGIGAVAAGYWFFRRGFTAVQEGAAVLTEPLAEGYVRLTSGPGVEPLSKIQLPNGQRLELGDVKIGQDFGFTWLGTRYRVTGRNIDGNYDAVLWGT